MGSFASLVVSTATRRRALTALRAAARAAADVRSRAEVEHCRAAQAVRFRADTRPPYTPGRVCVMTWAASVDTLDAVDQEIRRRLDPTAHETWRIVLQPVSVDGDWFGYAPDVDDASPLSVDEPAAVLINGILKPKYIAKFVRDSARVGEQLRTAAGYLGGLGFSDTPLATTSFSCWRTRRDSRAFAYGAGAHQPAYTVDLAEQRHRSSFFVRFRPLSTDGTLDGRDPFDGLAFGPPLLTSTR